MDFSIIKQLLKSRKGVYLTSGILGIAVVITVACVIHFGNRTDNTEQVMNDAPIVEEPVAIDSVEGETESEEANVTEEATETVAEEEVTCEAPEREMEETQANHKNNTSKTQESQPIVSEIQIPETEGTPLVQEVPTQEPASSESQETKTTNSQKTESSTGQSSSNSGSSGDSNKPAVDENKQDEYKLVWMDDFCGEELNTEDWNYEYHEPGWVNNELQEYVDSSENIYLEDGKLVIQAIKFVDENGKVSYTSGRVNTQNKHDYKYGRFEARAKVPSGKGFLPAFWMMPTDESFYGQWPKCGEIDIMEVLGDNLTVSHGTLHFGEPHKQSQGEYELVKGDFASEFHVFACEWEPGEIRFYVDGKLFHTENDWFTKREGYGEVAYPAPYDQPFYMILNLAVGGDWPGNPEPDAVFGDNAQLVVDYVKVYQKDSYDENVQKPIKEVVLGEPDTTGNYVRNGNFSEAESLFDSNNWQFMLAGEGAATAEISDNALHIVTTNAGSLDYSVQVVQAKQSLEQGYKYRLSFDVYADENRTIITGVTAPDLNYSRYLNDTKINLTTEAKNYSFEFDMLSDSDANGRVEFNLGNQGSTATVHITNVRLEKVCAIEIPEEVKTVLPDGNYVYNGEFQQGADRLDYWEVEKSCDGAQVFVTNDSGSRELKVTVPATVANLNEVIVKQSPIAITGGKNYVLSFEAYSDGNKTIKTVIGDKTFESAITTEKTTYRYAFETASDVNGANISFLLGAAGVTYIDNVRVQEDGMLINGDFANGTTGYEVYAYTASDVNYIVDGLKENNAFSIDIANTGDADWKIQLKQNNITLEEGKWYKLTLDAKSTLDRKIMYALQKDGTADNDWTPYSGTMVIDLDGSYETFSTTFQMTSPTDEKTILSISMGAVGGTVITEKHTVVIDNITLEEVDEPEKEPDNESRDEVVAGGELIKNGNFANGEESWENAITVPGVATASFADGKVVYNVTNPGTQDWHIQLKQSGLTLENGVSYQVSFKIKSSEARTVKYALLNPDAGYAWYGGEDLSLNAGEEKEINTCIDVYNPTVDTIQFVISMGLVGETPASEIEISDISIVKLGANVQTLSLEEGVEEEETTSTEETEEEETTSTEEETEKEEITSTEEKSEEEETTSTEEETEEEETTSTEEESEEKEITSTEEEKEASSSVEE